MHAWNACIKHFYQLWCFILLRKKSQMSFVLKKHCFKIILCFEDSWDRGVRIFVLCSFSALLSKVCVAGRLGDAKITSQDEYKALAYSSGHAEFHRLSPDDSAQCLDSGHCSRESWCWIWQGTEIVSPTKATQALLTPAPCSTLHPAVGYTR